MLLMNAAFDNYYVLEGHRMEAYSKTEMCVAYHDWENARLLKILCGAHSVDWRIRLVD
jgi:hypothetical protein